MGHPCWRVRTDRWDSFSPTFAVLVKVANELSLVHKSQRREQRDLTTRCDVSGGRSALWSVYKYNPPSVLLCPPLPPLNRITSMWGYMPMSSLTSFVPVPFIPDKIKTKSNLPGYQRQCPASHMSTRFSNPEEDIKSFKHCCEQLFQGSAKLPNAYSFLMMVKSPT